MAWKIKYISYKNLFHKGLQYLNRFLVINNTNLKNVLANACWLFFDKVLRFGIGLLVGIWVARYLEPTLFGLYNYAVAYFTLFSAFATLGLDTILVRELVKHPEEEDQRRLMGSAFVIKLAGGGLGILLAGISINYVQPESSETWWLVRLLALSFLFQAFDVIDYFYQSQVQSKYVVYARNGAFIILSFVKVILIVLKFPIIAFIWAYLAEIVLSALFLILIYQSNQKSISFWQFNLNTCINLLKDGFPLLLSSMMIMIYMRIDQIMIGNMLGEKEVGIYSAAVKIAEMWYFIPMIIASSVFPAILKAKSINLHLYTERLQTLYSIMTWLSLGVGLVFTVLSEFIIVTLYGQAYANASSALTIIIWSGIATSLGIATSQYLAIENLNKISFYRTLLGCIINVLLNLILIPLYGINGAATATLISYLLATFGIILFKPSRNQIYLILNSFNPYNLKKIINLK